MFVSLELLQLLFVSGEQLLFAFGKQLVIVSD